LSVTVAPSSGSSFARREREALCDLALSLGPDAPTLCGEWTVRDLVVHLLVRERKPWAAGGILVPMLSGLTDRASARLAARPLAALVEQLRIPALPLRAPGVDALVNTIEYFVHHEDLRRAQPSWAPRELSDADEAALWRPLSVMGRGLVRPAGVPVTIVSGTRRAVLRRGDDPVMLSGPVGEIALFLFGRAQASGLAFDGPADKVESLKAARLGF
jgi:uncharacterized protein (TIGR03085 family)